ncbi:hypothetical protein HPP92_010227 [Vanilla planifolia]|uniref:Uncharacterized protein n=1 Tax=Vanilla planifolia TaxID=51239 RepID=A0A835V1B3_VANPL|nr:hypothetical protein HPP92_010314 [Vanilla planifolia]KAG0482143.1 hypothetical protein HPP92_010227 [Vanilla planifolia]
MEIEKHVALVDIEIDLGDVKCFDPECRELDEMANAEDVNIAEKVAVKSAEVADPGLIAIADMAVDAIAGEVSAEQMAVAGSVAVVVHVQMVAEKFAARLAAEMKDHWMEYCWKL